MSFVKNNSYCDMPFDANTPYLSGGKPIVQLSVVYLNSLVQSTVIPYPVQVFGTLQWKKRPVIFAKILQVLSVPSAIRLRNALSGIANTHLARNVPKQEYEEDPS
ncbi:uncharacterized protein LOC110374667 isoform X2 [Helicoverpa armigera]|uniref:uncharacterized protein LOC110374667 isoform X2 n=1 Tax=Helicoverpa armigera TaxID=29058 RepID=UPI0030830C61